jgi:hypothetical protein
MMCELRAEAAPPPRSLSVQVAAPRVNVACFLHR